MCASLPDMCDIASFLRVPVDLFRKGPHAVYAREYSEVSPKVHTDVDERQDNMSLLADTPVAFGGAAYVNALAKIETSFFK